MIEMVDRQISAACVAAYGLWVGALGLWITSYLSDDPGLGNLSLMVTGAAVTATIRSYFIDQSKRIKTALAAAQALGDSPVRPLH